MKTILRIKASDFEKLKKAQSEMDFIITSHSPESEFGYMSIGIIHKTSQEIFELGIYISKQ